MRLYYTDLIKIATRRLFLVALIAAFICNLTLCIWTSKNEGIKAQVYKEFYTNIKDLKLDNDEIRAYIEERQQQLPQDDYIKRMLYNEALNQLDRIISYTDFLYGINVRADKITKVSIFGDKNSFSYRSIIKTPPAYKNLFDNQLKFGNSITLLFATSQKFTDIFVFYLYLWEVPC